ncbi:MAG TPA: hypothetical protein VH593_26940 [Ktedonobacteraceae bacterium]
MDIIYNGKFCYRSSSETPVGWCHLQILRRKTHCLLLSTELPDNPGLPLKNAVILIATQAVNLFGLDPAKLHFILHYPASSGRIEYYYVTTKWRGQPDFKWMGQPSLALEALVDGLSRMDLGQVNAILETLRLECSYTPIL